MKSYLRFWFLSFLICNAEQFSQTEDGCSFNKFLEQKRQWVTEFNRHLLSSGSAGYTIKFHPIFFFTSRIIKINYLYGCTRSSGGQSLLPTSTRNFMYRFEEIRSRLHVDDNALQQAMEISGVYHHWIGTEKAVSTEGFKKLEQCVSSFKKKVGTKYWMSALRHGDVRAIIAVAKEFGISHYSFETKAKKFGIPLIKAPNITLIKEKDIPLFAEYLNNSNKKKETKPAFVVEKTITEPELPLEDNFIEEPKLNKHEKGIEFYKKKSSDLEVKVFTLKNEIEAEANAVRELGEVIERKNKIITNRDNSIQELNKKIESQSKALNSLRNHNSSLVEDSAKLKKVKNAMQILLDLAKEEDTLF